MEKERVIKQPELESSTFSDTMIKFKVELTKLL